MFANTAAATLNYPVVEIPLPRGRLQAELAVVPHARGLVVFADADGRGMQSPGNQEVAERFHRAGFASLLPDLLTEEEEAAVDRDEATLTYDVPLLADRLLAVRDWVARDWSVADLPVGYFGVSTGAAAALVAAARRPHDVFAIVSRDGRPDLPWDLLPAVTAPTLLLVGNRAHTIAELNRQALERMHCPSVLKVVPETSDPAEASATWDEMATLAADWFLAHLPRE
jgi:putative phosphoribosyl transferase